MEKFIKIMALGVLLPLLAYVMYHGIVNKGFDVLTNL